MIYYVFGWYGEDPKDYFPFSEKRWVKHYRDEGTKKNPDRVEINEQLWTLEIDDIHKFVEDWGKTIQLSPPTKNFPLWSIYFSRDGRWSQR